MAKSYAGLPGIADPDTTSPRVSGEFPIDSFAYGAINPTTLQGGTLFGGGKIDVSSFTVDFGTASTSLRNYILQGAEDGVSTGTIIVDQVRNNGSIQRTEFFDTHLEEAYFSPDDLMASFDFKTIDIQYLPPPCFTPGTLVLTSRGERLVEALAIGDTVVTASSTCRPIRWIGRRSYAGRFLTANPGVQPVRFRAGSLGNGLPRRDLLVSPNHSMFLDGVLVRAHCLVNGTTITRERGLKQVEYFHVELDSHDVLLAEGAPSESFVDDDSRAVFHNAAEWERMYPGRARVPAVFCAPRVESGPELEAIRRRLAGIAGTAAKAA